MCRRKWNSIRVECELLVLEIYKRLVPLTEIVYFGAVFIFRKDCYDFKISGCYIMFYRVQTVIQGSKRHKDVDVKYQIYSQYNQKQNKKGFTGIFSTPCKASKTKSVGLTELNYFCLPEELKTSRPLSKKLTIFSHRL